MQGDGFASEPGGIMEVAVWLCVSLLLGLWCSLGLVPNYVVLVLDNEGGGPGHMQGSHTRIFLSFLIPMFSPKANMKIHFFISNQPHSHMYVQWLKVLI